MCQNDQYWPIFDVLCNEIMSMPGPLTCNVICGSGYETVELWQVSHVRHIENHKASMTIDKTLYMSAVVPILFHSQCDMCER